MDTNTTTFKTQRARFHDAKGSLLELLLRKMKDGQFQVSAYHTPKGGLRKRGCVGLFTEPEAGLRRFTDLCAEAEKGKWQRKVRKGAAASAFDTLPKAAA